MKAVILTVIPTKHVEVKTPLMTVMPRVRVMPHVNAVMPPEKAKTTTKKVMPSAKKKMMMRKGEERCEETQLRSEGREIYL